jgi:hypothetical protein
MYGDTARAPTQHIPCAHVHARRVYTNVHVASSSGTRIPRGRQLYTSIFGEWTIYDDVHIWAIVIGHCCGFRAAVLQITKRVSLLSDQGLIDVACPM